MAVLQEPVHPLAQARELLHGCGGDHFARDQRHEPHERSHAQRHGLAVQVHDVVVETVDVVPQTVAADLVHRVADADEMLEELAGDVFVRVVLLRELDGDAEHRHAIERHPRGAVRLQELRAAGQRSRAVEDPDVVEPEESAGEQVVPVGVLAVHPPGEVQQELVERPCQELAVTFPSLARHLVDAPACPSVHRRVHVAELELVGGNRAVRRHVPLAQEEQQLVLRELRIDARHRDHVKRAVPRGEPRILPRVRHRQDVARVEMPPFVIATRAVRVGRLRLIRIAFEPGVDGVVIELLRPQETGVGLTHDGAFVGAEMSGLLSRVECVVFRLALGQRALERRSEPILRRVGRRAQTQAQFARLAGRQIEPHDPSRFRTIRLRVDCVLPPVHDVLVERVLDVRDAIFAAEKTLHVRLVLGEDEFVVSRKCVVERQLVAPESGLVESDATRGLAMQARSHVATFLVTAPRPRVAEPHGWQHVQRGLLRPAVRDHDDDLRVVLAGFRVAHFDVEVAVFREDPRVDELVLRFTARPAPVLLDEVRVGELALRILVESGAPRMRRRRLEEEVLLLHVLAVIAFVMDEAEEALLQDRIAPVPQRDREADAALTIRPTEQSVLAPPVCATACVVVREIAPAIAVGGIVLPHGPPLSRRQVRPESLPVRGARRVMGQALGLGIDARRLLLGHGGRALQRAIPRENAAIRMMRIHRPCNTSGPDC